MLQKIFRRFSTKGFTGSTDINDSWEKWLVQNGNTPQDILKSDNSVVGSAIDKKQEVINVYDLHLYKVEGSENKVVDSGQEYLLWQEILDFTNKNYITSMRQYNAEVMKAYYDYGCVPVLSIYKDDVFQSITVAKTFQYQYTENYYQFTIHGYDGVIFNAYFQEGKYTSSMFVGNERMTVDFYPLLGKMRGETYISPLFAVEESIRGLNNVERFLESSFKNKARPHLYINAVVKESDRLTADEQRRRVREISTEVTNQMGVDNVGKPITLRGKEKTDVKILADPMTEQGMLPVSMWYEKRILQGMSCDIDFFYGGSTFNNKEQSTVNFHKSVTSWFKSYLQEFTPVVRDIFENVGIKDSRKYYVNIREEDNEVLESAKIDNTIKIKTAGIKTVNEVRSEMGLDPIEGGDTLIQGTPESTDF